MTILSLIGVVALSGVVVNDSLVLVDFINELVKEKGETVRDAVILAAKQRIRPILLTSVTTFAGLLPIIFETSLQAQFLIPMAISLGFGVIFSTVTTLILVPAGILMIEDIKDLVKGKKREVAQ
jgi:multidrug efflux pump subunit AcrB